MCGICGCSDTALKMPEHHHHHENEHADSRVIDVERALFEKNDRFAAANRALLARHRVVTFNVLSSPGAGKTTLLVNTIKALQPQCHVAVIEGDQQTENDAQRIRETGSAAVQINTGKGCHLDAHRVGHAFEQLAIDKLDILFIENVGNLVCPAGFDLGENLKIVVLSVTEGEDKPLKYPDAFMAAGLVIINKCDLLPYVDFDLGKCREMIETVNPRATIIELSATNSDTFGDWLGWLDQQRHGSTCESDI